jgi:hypothetical protein
MMKDSRKGPELRIRREGLEKHIRTEGIEKKLARIEKSLLLWVQYRKVYENMHLADCTDYINWCCKFGKITKEEADYFTQLILYALYELSADEEEALMRRVSNGEWR